MSGSSLLTLGFAPVDGTGFEGTASLVQREGKTSLELSFRGPGDGTEAVVLEGTCDDPGELLYPLTPVFDDSSHTELVMRIEDMTLGRESVVIALREEGGGRLLSCGVLDRDE